MGDALERFRPRGAVAPRAVATGELQRAAPAAEPWAEMAVDQARSSSRTAWIVACVMIVVCAAQAAAIALMLPLKELVPYTVLVDRQTGYVETARGLDLGALSEDRAIVEAMTAQYVLARETFDPADFTERYGQVALWSIGQARDDYVAGVQAGPDGLLAGLGAATRVTVRVKRIDILASDAARVRFETETRQPGAEPVRTDWRAVLTFRFTGEPMRMEDRLLNPLGFQVTGYRRDLETVEGGPTEAVMAAGVAPPAGATADGGETVAAGDEGDAS